MLKRTKNSWLFARPSLILANNFSPLSKALCAKESLIKYLVYLYSLFSFNTLACSCLGYDIEEAYKQYPIVFVGTVKKAESVITKEEGWFNYSKSKAITFDIELRYKGELSEKVQVITREDSAACGYPFQVDVKYAVFAFHQENKFHVTSCSPTIHMAKDEEYHEKERLNVTNFLSLQHST